MSPIMPIEDHGPRAGPSGMLVLFGATLFLSALLLFSVQPLFSKMVLPRLGGTPASWTYYAVAVVMIITGGIIAVAHASSGTTLNAILAIQIGASAPLILRKLTETVPETPGAPDPTKID